MIEYMFGANNNSATRKISEFIKSFSPKVNFEIEKSHFGDHINCKFENEAERDSFIKTLSNSLNVSEDGSYLG